MKTDKPRALTCRIRVRWSDLDALGHVNNARFFSYLEEARLEWFESLPEPWFTEESGPVVARACVDFHRPINGTGSVVVSTRAGRIGRSSMTLISEIHSDDPSAAHYATGEVVLVWVDRRSGRSTQLPEAVKRSIGA